MDAREKEIELWELIGDLWRLPIDVRWEEGFAHISLAHIPMLEAQIRVAMEVLAPYKNAAGEVVTSEEVLRSLARKSKATNPEDVVEWHRKPQPSMHFKAHPLVDEFLDAFVAKGSCPSRPLMSAIYSMLLAHMVDWMVNKKKPLDLIFCTLYPLQVRRNWKEIVLGKAALRGEFNLTRIDQYRPEVEADMTDMSIIGLTKDNKRAVWTIECVPGSMWGKVTDELETKRKSRLRNGGYWFSVRDQLKRQLPYALESYRPYITALRAKTTSIPVCTKKRVGACFTAVKNRNGDAAWVVPLVLPAEEEPSSAGPVAPADEDVPEVLAIRPGAEDLRDSGQDVPK